MKNAYLILLENVPLTQKNNAIGLIVDPTGFDESNLLNTSFGITFYSDGYIINSSSPLINSGNNVFLPDNIDFDIVGNTRVFGEIVDIGALEYPGFDQEPPSSDDFPPPPPS